MGICRFLFRINYCVCLILIGSNLIYGQQSKFDSIFYNTAVNISSKDVNRALHIADSLYSNTKEEKNKIRALMLSADIYKNKGNINAAINYALKANLIAENSNNYEWIARISGFLSTQYRLAGLKSPGLKFLSRGQEVSKKIANANTSNQFQVLVFQEKAYYQMDDEKFSEAVESLKKANQLFTNIKDSQIKFFLLATNEEMLGKNISFLHELQSAKKHYLKSLFYLKKASGDDSSLKGFVYDGLGKIYLEEKKYNEAHSYFLKAIAIAERSDFANLKIETYKDLSKYCYAINDMPNYKVYNELYNKNLQNQIGRDRHSANEIVSLVNSNSIKSLNKKNEYLNALIVIIVVLTLFFLIYVIQKKREQKKFQRVLKLIKEQSLGSKKTQEHNSFHHKRRLFSKDEKSNAIMSPDVEKLLIEKLREFELSNKFTDNNISLSSLSTLLDTNSKYLSYVINNYKGKDFNAYINELRIFFIINKIENDEAYTYYKISYLAQEAGFSSHSKFSAVFKSVMGLSPSVFLDQYNSSKKVK